MTLKPLPWVALEGNSGIPGCGGVSPHHWGVSQEGCAVEPASQLVPQACPTPPLPRSRSNYQGSIEEWT